MTDEPLTAVNIVDNFYGDCLNKVRLLIILSTVAVALLAAISGYVFFTKPKPIVFYTGDNFRILKEVALSEPYLSRADLYQWVSTVLPQAFNVDFKYYYQELDTNKKYFTERGWTQFLNQLNLYANYNNVLNNKLFVKGTPGSAPAVTRDGPLENGYGWWITMSININYFGVKTVPGVVIPLNILVIRVSTLDNIAGVKIDNIEPASGGNNADKNG